MMGKTHYTFAAATVITLTHYQFLPITVFPVMLVSAMIGSLLPDLDSPNSSFGRFIPIGSWLFQNILGHRSVTHSILALILLYFSSALLLSGNWASPFRFGLLIGYASHIMGDMIVGGGVSLFWPIRNKITLNPVKLTVGGPGEYFLFLGLLGWSVFLLFKTFQNFI